MRAASQIALPIAVLLVGILASLSGGEAVFYRAINLNGPALEIDGRHWEGKDAPDLRMTGSVFENQSVPLKPPTDAARTRMIRSSRWGSEVDIELTNVPAGAYQVFLYVWEDNNSERFDLLVNGTPMIAGFVSGSAGTWQRLGPWLAASDHGRLKISARGPGHGAANLSGLEVWAGDGALPTAPGRAFAATPTTEQAAFFEQQVRPLLVDQCYSCHSTSAKKLKGGLLLDSRAGVQKGGDTGPAVTPGDPDASLLIQAVRHADPDLAMPPERKLPDAAIAVLEAWVKMGAPDPRSVDSVAAASSRRSIDWDQARSWWSFRPLTEPAVPATRDNAWPADDIDRFILARLDEAGLRPGDDAEPRALLRRATYDLTGLPPTPDELAEFLGDHTPGAFARVVDRLLASPRYGERWGRHWLDVVRYADSAGDNSDFPIPQMHRYRDWVIAAFNRDLPYDRFVREQLAGDLMGGTGEERTQRIIATGYLANARRFGSRVDDYPWHLTIEDTIGNVGRAFLGLSIGCARCHDHKFDPIPSSDYYALYGIFSSTRLPWPGIELEQRQRDLVPLVPADEEAAAQATIAARAAEQQRLDHQGKQIRDEVEKSAGEQRKQADARLAAAETSGAAASAIQSLKDEIAHAAAQRKQDDEARIATAERACAELKDRPLPFAMAYAVADADPAKRGDACLQFKGDPAKPGERIRRHFLSVFGGQALASDDRSSGRLALADWLMADSDPLPARVMANRIWHYHFGRGLVATPNDFGKQGKPPSHPQLLDHLATRLRGGGWSVKALHRAIMLSHTYRLAAQRSGEALAKDPSDELLAAFPRHRLDAESLRDTLLTLGGNLDLSPAGPQPFPKPSTWNFTQHNAFKALYESERRSVFLMTQRIQRHPYLAIFDGADPSTSTPERPTSTTPVQALFLLNDPFLHGQAERFAQRLHDAAADPDARLRLAYVLALARPPLDDERAAARDFLAAIRAKERAGGRSEDDAERASWCAYARVLFRLNEFIYLD